MTSFSSHKRGNDDKENEESACSDESEDDIEFYQVHAPMEKGHTNKRLDLRFFLLSASHIRRNGSGITTVSQSTGAWVR